MNKDLSTHIQQLKQKVLASKEKLLKESLLLKKRTFSSSNPKICSDETNELFRENGTHESKDNENPRAESTVLFVERFNKRMKVISDEMNGPFSSSGISSSTAFPIPRSSYIKETVEDISYFFKTNKAIDGSNFMIDRPGGIEVNQSISTHDDFEPHGHDLDSQSAELPAFHRANNVSQIENLNSKILSTKESLLKNLLRLKRKRKASAISNNTQTSTLSTSKTKSFKYKTMKVKLNISKMKRNMRVSGYGSPSTSYLKSKPKPNLQWRCDVGNHLMETSSSSGAKDGSNNTLKALQSKLMKCKESALKNLLKQKLKSKEREATVPASSTQSKSKQNIGSALKGWATRHLNKRKAIQLPTATAVPRLKPAKQRSSDKKFIEKLLDIIRKQKQELHDRSSSSAHANSKKVSSSQPKPCQFFIRHGKCRELEYCHFLHDPSHIRLCPNFLNNSACGESDCKLFHEEDPEKLPDCKYYSQGSCVKERCRYRHKDLLPLALPCASFRQGRCALGIDCPQRHEYAERAKTSTGNQAKTEESDKGMDLDHGATCTIKLVDAEKEKDVCEWVIESSHGEALFLPLPASGDGLDLDDDNIATFTRYYR